MKSLLKILIFTILVFTCKDDIFSQSYAYKHYEVEDGLPSSEVYFTFQDSKEYIWFATDAGVSRFNGYEFENFDANNGLLDNTVFLITEDKTGRIWFGTFNLKLSYYENDSIYPYKYNQLLKDSLKGKHDLCSFVIDSDENVWLGFGYKGLKKIDKNGHFHNIHGKFNLKNRFDILKRNGKIIYGETKTQNFPFIDLHYEVQENSIIKKYDYQLKKEARQPGRANVLLFGDTLLIQENTSGIYRLINNSRELSKLSLPIFFLNQTIIDIYYEDGFLYLCCTKKGVYKCSIKANSINIEDHFLDGLSISSMYKDKEGGFWFTSLNKGVYYSPSFLVTMNDVELLMTEQDEVIKILTDGQGNLFIITKERLFVQNLSTKIIRELSLGKVDAKIYFNSILKHKVILMDGRSFRFENDSLKKIKLNNNYNGKIYISDSNSVYIGTSFGLMVIKEEEKEYFPKNAETFFCTSLIKDKNNVWVGANDGIRIYRNKKITYPFSTNKYLSSAITSMERFDKNTFLIGTKNYGLLIIKGDSVHGIIDESDGLVGNLVRTIHIDKQKIIWVGTNKGLSKINYVNKNRYKIYNLTQKKGLISDEIIDIDSYKNTMYVATKKGLMEFDKTKIKMNLKPPLVYITSFNINEEKKLLVNNYQLKYNENNLSITYEGLNFRNLGEVEYQYRVMGIDTNWIITTTRNVRYPTLPSGNYIFEIKAKNEDGFWSDSTSVSFIIYPPFWLTWWFILFFIGFLLIIIYLGVKYRIKHINEKNEIRRKITVSEKKRVEQELMALRAQMNPHFIFNTLNTIQNAVNTKDKKVASNYIATFGRLIRIVLETSKKPKIKVNTEIELLELYVGLESERFSNKFSVSITKDVILSEENFYIPSMVIQPFVENAILHGLAPKKSEDLQLKIHFKLKNKNTIICVIEDNGIGKEASTKINKMKQLNKKSLGMEITKNRLDLFEKDSGKSFSFNVLDLIDNEQNPLGTKVEIVFSV